MINKEIQRDTRQLMGKHLKKLRLKKQISTYQMQKSGVRHETMTAIESGDSNYSMDGFLAYVTAIDCYFYLADKYEKHLDSRDLLAKS